MCCIFTCCGWMIDLVQRLWTFTMSCCISSAVCCLMTTGSVSGIALGYNYSLAEYIDLKETNVSVYLKRGVFDDEIADDMDWRRSGRMPVAGHIGTDNLMTGAPAEDDSTPLQSGRRLDDSVFESDDPNKYEGSLMRLTAQPLDATTTGSTHGPEYVESDSKFLPGSLDQLKAIQGLVSARKSAMGNAQGSQQQTTYADIDERFMANLAPNPNLPPQGRRMMVGPNMVDRLNPARLAVPSPDIGSKDNWIYPKHPANFRKQFSYSDIDYPDFKPEYPKSIRIPTAPIRPPTPTPAPEMRTNRPENEDVLPSRPRLPPLSIKPEMDAALKNFKERMMLEKFEAPVHDIYPKRPKDSSDDYDEDVKGLPVRRRRRNIEKRRDDKTKIFKETEITEVFKSTVTDSTLKSIEITDNDEILNGKEEKEYSMISNEDTQTIIRHDSMKTLVDDETEITTAASLLPCKLLLELISKKYSKRKDDHSGNIDNSSKDIINNIWNRFSGKSGKDKEDKFVVDSRSEGTMSKAAKRLDTIGLSVNYIEPSTMMRILQSQYTIA